MRLSYLMIMLFMLAPMASAIVIQTNTSITVDWIGNDMFYVRTESGDMLLNSTNQVDSSYAINITRHTTTNQTEFELILDYMANMTSTCSNLSLKLNFTEAYYSELSHNYSRCSLDKAALMEQAPLLQASLNNVTVEYTHRLDVCTTDRDTAMGSLNTCTDTLQNTTTQLTREKSANSQKTILVVICVLIAGVLIFQEVQKKQKAHPDEMSLLGQT